MSSERGHAEAHEAPLTPHGEDRELSVSEIERDFVARAMAARVQFEQMDVTAIAEAIADVRACGEDLLHAFHAHEQRLAELNGLADTLRARGADDAEAARCLPQLADLIPRTAKLLHATGVELRRLDTHLTELEAMYRRRTLPRA